MLQIVLQGLREEGTHQFRVLPRVPRLLVHRQVRRHLERLLRQRRMLQNDVHSVHEEEGQILPFLP
jgi:hypothetical protein